MKKIEVTYTSISQMPTNVRLLAMCGDVFIAVTKTALKKTIKTASIKEINCFYLDGISTGALWIESLRK